MFDFMLQPLPWLAFPLLVLGFLPLIYGADRLVDGAASLAKRMNVPTLVIGLTIVAFGTSAPELAVNLFAAGEGKTDLAFGNIVGSNIFNILGILGVAAVIAPLVVKRSSVIHEIPLIILSTLILGFLANDIFFDGAPANVLTRIDGLVLLGFFAVFMAYNVNLARKGILEEETEIKELKAAVAVFFVLLGIGLLVLGGKMIVEGAVVAARSVGLSERVIGLTVVSIGTSLPELATSAVAAYKKNSDIAVGNIVGSNIFNVFFILGLTAFITPVPVNSSANLDLGVNLFATVLLFGFILFSKGKTIRRWHGVVFLACLVAYISALLILPQTA